jgi:hypothetical protein
MIKIMKIMKRIIFSAAFSMVAMLAFSQSREIPQSVIMDEAVTLDKGGACFAFKQNGGKEMDFWPGVVFFTDQGLVIGMSAEKPHHYSHDKGEKTNYFFYPNAEVNKDALRHLGITKRIGLLFENGQWNVVSIEPKKTGGGQHVELVCIAGKVSTKTIDDVVYAKRMAPDLWHPKMHFVGAVLLGGYGQGMWHWPFSLYNAANQRK